VVSLPAEAEANDPLGRQPGEWLWDDEYGYAKSLVAQKRVQPARNWSAMYQQTPVPDTGDYFKAEWLRPYDKAPPRSTLKVYGASDYAVTADGGDYTVHIVVGVDPQWRIYLLDIWRKQTSSAEWIEVSVFKCFGTISGIWNGGSGSFGLEFRRLSTDVAIVVV
jgi:hypothetical protein